MPDEKDDVEILEIDRIAANNFIKEDIERRFLLARKNSDLENSLKNEALSLSEYILNADPRTSCILAVSFLEDAIKRNFVDKWGITTPKMHDQFFGSNGPLSTFFQRVTVAQGLGWVPEKGASDIATLRKLRNEFAHNHLVHSLNEEPLLSLASKLSPIEQIWNIEGATYYQTAYSEASRELRLGMRIASCVFLNASAILARSNLIKVVLPPNYRERGFDGLTQVEQDFIDVTAQHCFKALGIERSGLE